MSKGLDPEVAKALKNARQQAFEANMETSQYADEINDLANENGGGVLDVAGLADENSTAITDLADYIASLEKRIIALESEG